MLRFSPRMLLLIALPWFADLRATAHAQEEQPAEVEAPAEVGATPEEVAPPVEGAPVPMPAADTRLTPTRDTGCRPGDCPARDAAAWAPSTLAPAPAPSGERPAPGAILHTTHAGQTHVYPAPRKRLPKLWPPIVLISVGATLLAPGLTIATLAMIEGDSEEFSTADGITTLLVGGGLFGGGLVWLNRRRAKRRKILEESRGLQTAWDAGQHAGPRLSLGAHGLGARVRLQM